MHYRRHATVHRHTVTETDRRTNRRLEAARYFKPPPGMMLSPEKYKVGLQYNCYFITVNSTG